jgi:hypothetical protein
MTLFLGPGALAAAFFLAVSGRLSTFSIYDCLWGSLISGFVFYSFGWYKDHGKQYLKRLEELEARQAFHLAELNRREQQKDKERNLQEKAQWESQKRLEESIPNPADPVLHIVSGSKKEAAKILGEQFTKKSSPTP